MKKQSITAISKKGFTLLLAAFLLTGMSQKTHAAPDNSSNKGAEVTYQGLQDNTLVFNVSYKNELSQPFYLVVKNAENDVLYIKKHDGIPLNTRILFTEVPQNGKLTFVIVTGKKEVAQTFEINRQVKVVEELTVKGM